MAECESNYRQMLFNNGIIDEEDTDVKPGDMSLVEVTGVVTDIRSAVMNGNTMYFVRLEGGDTWFSASAAEVPALVLLNVGDQVRINYVVSAGGIAQPIYTLEIGIPVPKDPTVVSR